MKNHNVVERMVDNFFDILPDIIFRGIIIIAIILVWSRIINWTSKVVVKLMKRRKMDPLLESFVSSVITTIMYIILFFIIIGVAGVKATSLLTVLGSAGLAVGLALQGSLSNLAGGVLILFFKPFIKGDYITTTITDVAGTVDNIQILYTTLLTPDNKVIVVPNSQLANSAVTNFSTNATRRLDMIFSVGYESSTAKVKEILNKIADEHPAVLKDKPYTIRMSVQNASSLDFVFRVWVKKEDYWNVKFDITEIVKDEFDANGIEIPYQKIDIYRK